MTDLGLGSLLGESHQTDVSTTSHRQEDADLLQPRPGQNTPNLAVDGDKTEILIQVWSRKGQLEARTFPESVNSHKVFIGHSETVVVGSDHQDPERVHPGQWTSVTSKQQSDLVPETLVEVG